MTWKIEPDPKFKTGDKVKVNTPGYRQYHWTIKDWLSSGNSAVLFNPSYGNLYVPIKDLIALPDKKEPPCPFTIGEHYLVKSPDYDHVDGHVAIFRKYLPDLTEGQNYACELLDFDQGHDANICLKGNGWFLRKEELQPIPVFSVGDYVRINPTIKNPLYLWTISKREASEIGQVKNVLSDFYLVNFPSYECWKAAKWELLLVEKALQPNTSITVYKSCRIVNGQAISQFTGSPASTGTPLTYALGQITKAPEGSNGIYTYSSLHDVHENTPHEFTGRLIVFKAHPIGEPISYSRWGMNYVAIQPYAIAKTLYFESGKLIGKIVEDN